MVAELLSQPVAEKAREMPTKGSQKPGQKKPKKRNGGREEFRQLEKALDSRDFKEITQIFRSYDSQKIQQLSKFGIPSQLFREVFRQTTSAQSTGEGLTLRETLNKLLDGGVTTGWIVGMSIVQDIANGQPEEGLESWVRFVEARGSPEKAVAAINREAAVAALAAYIVNCNKQSQPVDPDLALKLVPLAKSSAGLGALPLANEVYQIHGSSRLSPDMRNVIEQGLKEIRLAKLDPNSVEFLSSLPSDRPMELDQRYREAQEKCAATGTHLSEAAYARFISCYTDSTRIQTAFDVWNRMLQEGVRPRVASWNALLKAGALSRVPADKRVVVVEDLWKKMTSQESPKVETNSESFAILLDIYFRTQEYDKAVEVFERLQAGEYGPHITVTIRVFNVVLNGFLTMGKLEEAEALLESGEQKGLTPNVITYNTFMRSYMAAKNFDKATNLLEKMARMNVMPDITTYANVIDTLFKAAEISGGKENLESQIQGLLNEMNRSGLKSNTITITTIIRGLIKSYGDIEAARFMFEMMLKKHIPPNNRTFSTIIDGELTSQKGKMENAFHYFNMMPRYGLPQPTPIFNQLIHHTSIRGQLDLAYELLEKLNNKAGSANKFSYYFILSGCLKNNNIALASSIIQNHLDSVPSDFDFGDKLPWLLKSLANRGAEVPSQLLSRVNISKEN